MSLNHDELADHKCQYCPYGSFTGVGFICGWVGDCHKAEKPAKKPKRKKTAQKGDPQRGQSGVDHAITKRRTVVDLVKRSAISGSALRSPAVSKREDVTGL